jgi:hypothetical protein
VLDDPEAGRHVFEHLALVLVDPAEGRAAAARAGARGLVGYGLSRQMLRQRPTDRLAAFAWFGRARGIAVCGRIGRGGAGVFRGSVLFERADQQFELLDLAIELLRGTAEPGAPQHGKLHLELFRYYGANAKRNP